MNKTQEGSKDIRDFVRKITTDLGLLNKSPYAPELNLLESRTIFELAQKSGLRSKDLAHELAIDKGYLSRVLASLKRRKLIVEHPSKKDRREKFLTLTDQGKKLFNKIDKASNQSSNDFLHALGPSRSCEFLKGISAARLAMNTQGAIRKDDIYFESPGPGDLGWIIQRHGEIYHQEFGWNQDFENLVAEIALSFFKKHDSQKERAWIAKAYGIRLGCVFLVKGNTNTAQLRLLLVEPWARGVGLGGMLVSQGVCFARKKSYKKVILWTNHILTSARKIYEAEDFQLVKEEKHRSFGKDLIGQYWEKTLVGTK